MADFNGVDYIIIGILALSVLAGLLRGLVKEVLGLLTWIVAFVVSTMFAGQLANTFASKHTQSATPSTDSLSAATDAISSSTAALSSSTNLMASTPGHPSLLAVGTSFICIFIGILIIGKFITYFISAAVDGGGVGFGNRFLGAIFGFARGVLFALLVIFLVQLSPIASQSYWKESKLVPFFQPGIKWLNEAIEKPGFANIKSQLEEKWNDVNSNYFQGNNNPPAKKHKDHNE